MKLWQRKTIESLLKNHHKTIKKSLSQNYLIDHNILTKIARLVGSYPADHSVVEVGPGLGGLTQALLEETETSSHRVLSVEIEPLSYNILQQVFLKESHFPESWKHRLQFFNQDIRKFELMKYLNPPIVMVGNLPYHEATHIIIETLEKYKPYLAGGIFMIQKEVAERLTAKLGDVEYSLISVIAAALAQTKKIFNVPPHSFYPPPKVESSVIQMTPHYQDFFESPIHYALFKGVAKAAFQHRRKLVGNSVKLVLEKSDSLPGVVLKEKKFALHREQLDHILAPYQRQRAENLSVENYVEIARSLLKILPTLPQS